MVTIIDKDKLLRDGVRSPVDGQNYRSRREWNEHLKVNNCVEVGNDFNNAKPRAEIRGEFATKGDIAQAVNEVFDKRGIK